VVLVLVLRNAFYKNSKHCMLARSKTINVLEDVSSSLILNKLIWFIIYPKYFYLDISSLT
jgi:hypothetical protein